MAYISGGNELLDPKEILSKLGVRKGSRIADLGCGGAGHFIIPAASLVGEKTTAYAVDILKSILRAVISKARLAGINNIKSVWSNLEIVGATKIKEKSLDFTLLINILFQSKEQESIIKEAVRLLKNKGRLLVIDWDKTLTSFGPPTEDRVKSEEVKEIARKLNLKLIDKFQAGNYHYGLIFEK